MAEDKGVYVRRMFTRIAHRYDRMNRLMTWGQDRAWRRRTVALAMATEMADSGWRMAGGGWVLDVATGTGDLAIEVHRQRPSARVVGLDFVLPMLALARRKAAAVAGSQATCGLKATGGLQAIDSEEGGITFTAGDALRLPFGDGSFDAVVTGFALRNLTDIAAAFAEMARVTRPGGAVACLEIAKPRLPVIRHLFAVYFYRLVPLLGKWLAGESSAYRYLPHSLTAFLTPKEIATVMRQTGWRDVRYGRLMAGAVAVHVGVRECKTGWPCGT